MGYSFRLKVRVLLYAPCHRQDSTYHGLCYTSRGTLAGTRNSSMGPPHEGSIQRPIASWANALTMELHLATLYIRDSLEIIMLFWGYRINTHLFYRIYSSFLEQNKLLHSTKMWRTVIIDWQCSHWGEGSFLKMYEWVKCVWPMRARHKTISSFLHRM